MEWFSVDKEGLAKLVDKKPKSFIVGELAQNVFDEKATFCKITLTPIPGRPMARIEVEDDSPEGFADLRHAWTMFAESKKKSDPTLRGRFNLGEKLVLALCEEAVIETTTGSVMFDKDGRRESRRKRPTGSVFAGVVRMTREELAECERYVHTLIAPPHCRLYFNGEEIRPRSALASFEATLPTETSDIEGYLRPSARKTMVSIYEVRGGETPMLYEMGIPVVELGGGERWHVSVGQRVPLNVDRDNVTPSYLKTIRVFLANEMREHLNEADAKTPWIHDATEDKRIAPETLDKVLTEKFGEDRAGYDPSDPEANKELMNQGYQIIPGGALSGKQWENVKAFGLVKPSGQIRPSAFTYSANGKPERVIHESEYTPGQRNLVEFTKDLGERLLGKSVRVKIINEPTAIPYAGLWGDNQITFNLGRLGKAWFENGIEAKHLGLILHEFAHDKVSDHLTREFADEVCRLAVKLFDILVTDPAFFSHLKYSGYKGAR